MLTAAGAWFRFHPDADGSTLELRAEVTPDGGVTHVIEAGEFVPVDHFALDLTALAVTGGYTLQLYLDDALAYAGRYQPPREAT